MSIAKNEITAELIGMILGDGNLGNYPKYCKKKSNIPRCQYLRIYCNLKEKQYAKEIKSILEKVFDKKSYLYERPSENILYYEISLNNLDKYLEMPIGDKIKNKVKIPGWIFEKEVYLVSCLRGLFDTDGCCYLTGRKYRIVNFCNKNVVLLRNIYKALKLLKFHPYKKGVKDVELGRQGEVNKFFDIIKPKNVKHYRYMLK